MEWKENKAVVFKNNEDSGAFKLDKCGRQQFPNYLLRRSSQSCSVRAARRSRLLSSLVVSFSTTSSRLRSGLRGELQLILHTLDGSSKIVIELENLVVGSFSHWKLWFVKILADQRFVKHSDDQQLGRVQSHWSRLSSPNAWSYSSLIG